MKRSAFKVENDRRQQDGLDPLVWHDEDHHEIIDDHLDHLESKEADIQKMKSLKEQHKLLAAKATAAEMFDLEEEKSRTSMRLEAKKRNRKVKSKFKKGITSSSIKRMTAMMKSSTTNTTATTDNDVEKEEEP